MADTAPAIPAAVAPDGEKPTYYLVDGSGFIFRAFHTIPMRVRKSDGVPTNAVYGFAAMVMKLLADIDAERVAVIFDADSHTFRNDIYDAYKANRSDPPEELVPQFGLIRDTTAAFGLPCIEVTGYEADDIIATYCREARAAGAKVVVVSSDKDLMQLVGDGVTMFDPMKNKPIDQAEVVEKFGVGPDRVVDVQALAGDSVDNIPGVPGIGIKTAAQLIAEYGDLDSLLDRAEEIKQPKRRENLIAFADQARLSRRLVRLADDVPLPLALDALKAAPDPAVLTAFLRSMEFPSLVGRVQAKLTADGAGDSVPADTAPVAEDAAGPIETDYALVTDAAALRAWVDRATDAGVVAVDTETTSLNAAVAGLVGISLAVAPGQACYIPLGHTVDDQLTLDGPAAAAPQQLDPATALTILKPLLEDPSVLKVGQNLKYDHQILARQTPSIQIAPSDDTMLLSYTLDGGANGHGMDELARLHLDHETISFDSLTGTGKARITFDKVPMDKARDYAAEDADITLRLHRFLKPRLARERMTTVYETIERPLVGIIGTMERTGIKVDRAVLEDLSRDFAGRMGTLEEEVHTLAGHAFNVGSPKQLGVVLFDELGLPGGKKGKTGAYSTHSDVLEPLATQGHTIAEKVLDWRQLSKLKGTYTDALVDQINPQTGRVHTSFSLAATNTGRLSSNDPNLQNIPVRTEAGRKIRGAFVAEDGWRLLSVDYSQIELRLVAHIAGVAGLKDAFLAGEDIHATTASQVFGVPTAEMTPEIRRQAKAINFGIIYGISGYGLSQHLGITPGEAKTYIDQYLDRFHELRDWITATKAFCRTHGYVETLFGRKCHMPGIKDSNPARRGFAERQAINAPIQGTAADIIKRAMVRLPAALSAAGLDARLLLQVHDELVFEVPDAQVDATADCVRNVMEAAAQLSVPLVAEAGSGATWAAAH